MRSAFRLVLLTAAVAAASFSACSSGGGGSGGGSGSSGGGSASSGGGSASSGGGSSSSGGGTSSSGGGNFAYDGGTTISAIKGAEFCKDNVTIKGVIVTGVEQAITGSGGDINTNFWVADPQNPKSAIYVKKFYTDLPKGYSPAPGDVIDINGYLVKQAAFDDRQGYRVALQSQFGCGAGNDGGLTISNKTTGGLVQKVSTPNGFGNADGGLTRPNPDFAGAYVSIPGPLTLTDVSPLAMKRVSAKPNDNLYFGFEVSGGVLVNNFNTFDLFFSDGGSNIRCDFRRKILDGGATQVTFPNGISGIWDTYTHATCSDGGTDSNCRRDNGKVPGTNNFFTYVLYPLDCGDLPGDAG